MKNKSKNGFFDPDNWNDTLITGLEKILQDLRKRKLKMWEVGVGNGYNLTKLAGKANFSKVYFSDFKEGCAEDAFENIKRHGGYSDEILHPLVGSWNLLTPPEASSIFAPKVDLIFGCIPQVPKSPVTNGYEMAHYYDPQKYSSEFNAFGLGLNHVLLLRAKKILNPDGPIVLNLAGRPGLKKIFEMFDHAGYKPDLVHQEIVPQHVGTSLQSLASIEHNGVHEFEFFSDEKGRKIIGAKEAERRRIYKEPVFHMLYVTKGTVV